MSFADMMECANDTALENGEIVFSAVDVNESTKARKFIVRSLDLNPRLQTGRGFSRFLFIG
jgi:hypothetical protein